MYFRHFACTSAHLVQGFMLQFLKFYFYTAYISGDSVVLDVVHDVPEDASLGQTLKRPFVTHSPEVQKCDTTANLSLYSNSGSDGDVLQHIFPKDIGDQSNCFF